MNINTVGPSVIKNTSVPSSPERKTAERWSPVELENAAAASAEHANENTHEVLSTSEKNYFEQLYPSSVETIRQYHTYQRDGISNSTQLGSRIDLKG